MKLKIIGLFALIFTVGFVAWSQQPQGQPPQPAQPHPPDPLAQNLFPPDLVMQHRQALGLSDEQKNAIKDEVLKASTRFTELQWQMQDEMETMASLTKGATVDEQRVLAELDKILGIEREVKRTQLSLTIRIKNKLTPEQQARLQEMQHRPLQPPQR
jgi:Spy/CpxP family protein refolding chaperone